MSEVVLVARSIGRRSAAEPLSDEGHAGLIFVDGAAAFVAQAGPSAGLLVGAVASCAGQPWRPVFAQAAGAVWDTGATLVLPVSILWRGPLPSLDPERLASITAGFNARRLPYRYETGPNSNSFVRFLLEALGVRAPRLPAGALLLRGWGWREAPGEGLPPPGKV